MDDPRIQTLICPKCWENGDVFLLGVMYARDDPNTRTWTCSIHGEVAFQMWTGGVDLERVRADARECPGRAILMFTEAPGER